jgi:integrase
MTGHIHRRGKNSWTVVVDVGRDPTTGKRRQLRRSVKGTRRDAEALAVELLHQRDGGIDAPPSKLMVGEYLQRWLKDYASSNTAPRTCERYQQIVLQHLIPALGGIPLTRLRPQHIQAYYSKAREMGRIDGREGVSLRRPSSTIIECSERRCTMPCGGSFWLGTRPMRWRRRDRRGMR